MRILYLCSDHGVDLSGVKGASIHVRSMVHAFTELGHEVRVIGTKVSSPESFHAVTHATALPAPLASWNRKLLSAMKSGNPGRRPGRGRDVIRALHNFEYFKVADQLATRFSPSFIYERYSLWGIVGTRLARKRSIPLVLEVNSPLTYEERYYRDGLAVPTLANWAEHHIWRRADLLIAVSEEFYSHFEKAGVAREKVRILPNAVDTSLFGIEADDASLRRHMNLDGRFVVGFVGSFKAWHGVDFLFNNAGIIPRGTILETSDDMWHAAMDVNLTAMFYLCRAVIPAMKERGGGAIVNTSSVWGVYPGPGHIAYCTSKGAVASFTRSLGRDHAPDGIRVNAVCPNEVNTPMLRTGFERRGLDPETAIEELHRTVPLGHVAEPEEIADVMTFLASDDARYIAGSTLEVTGAKPVGS